MNNINITPHLHHTYIRYNLDNNCNRCSIVLYALLFCVTSNQLNVKYLNSINLSYLVKYVVVYVIH